MAGRGLTEETLKRFEIGYAPDARHHQTQHFQEKGMLDEAIAAGLIIQPEDGGAPYDRFRGRLMFPIRDPRGRCIAFGGRAMDPEDGAKYLNLARDRALPQGAHALQSRPRARGRRQGGHADRGRGLYGRDRARRSRVRPCGGAPGHRDHRGAARTDVADRRRAGDRARWRRSGASRG